MQSGSPLAEWAAIPDLFRMQNTSRLYADRLGCVVEQSYKLIECLRSRSFEELGNIRLIVSAIYILQVKLAIQCEIANESQS